MDGREKIKIKALKGAWWKPTTEIFTLVQIRKLIIPNTSRKISNLEYTRNPHDKKLTVALP